MIEDGLVKQLPESAGPAARDSEEAKSKEILKRQNIIDIDFLNFNLFIKK